MVRIMNEKWFDCWIKKGKFYTQFSFTTISNYDTLFGEPNYSNFGKYTDNTFQLYGEYGLSDKTTLIVNLPIKNISGKFKSSFEE